MKKGRPKRKGSLLQKFAMMPAGMSLGQWLRIIVESGGIERKYWLKALWISVLTVAYTPLRILEQIRFGQKIENTEIKHPPIFILGHWRSGTSYLHRLLTQDKTLGYASATQIGFNSEFYLTSDRFIKLLLGDQAYLKAAAYPLEDEYAILHASPFSFYRMLCFPRRTHELFKKFILFQQIDTKVKQCWKQVYLKILKKLTISTNGKRLVLKNPMNTGRIRLLLEMFPDAKFIHIYRNPYAIYCSLQRLEAANVYSYRLQSFSDEEWKEATLFVYRELMQAYLEQKRAIPPENLVEIRYEDFVKNQIGELERIYQSLNLPGFAQAKEAFIALIENESKKHQSQDYQLNQEVIDKIKQNWQFTLDKWQYELPTSIQVVS
ncbi:sulfotransferase [Sphaerothrix gracilis]|uniref:sulfotransferase family protein n=1 Tax=Sphaerothrix gracilis TaxID=3151835 RepID=UPI0031FC01E9